jgi:hypothetical protein
MDNNINHIFSLPATVFDSEEWRELEKKEYSLGTEVLLDEIINKKLWSNAEILWVLKRMIFYYGKKDALLKKAPMDRIFNSMIDVLRAFYIIFDKEDPDIDDNMRSYISIKLSDATWGINSHTRDYLCRIKDEKPL